MPTKEPTLQEQLQKKFHQLEADRLDYEAKKEIANNAYAHKEQTKMELIELMKQVGFKSFKTMENTNVSIIAKPYFTVSSEETVRKELRKRGLVKQYFYEHLDKTRLNSYLNQLVKSTGEVIDGVEQEIRETIAIKNPK